MRMARPSEICLPVVVYYTAFFPTASNGHILPWDLPALRISGQARANPAMPKSPTAEVNRMAIWAPSQSARKPTIRMPKGLNPMHMTSTPMARLRISGGEEAMTMADCMAAKPDMPNPPSQSAGRENQNWPEKAKTMMQHR